MKRRLVVVVALALVIVLGTTSMAVAIPGENAHPTGVKGADQFLYWNVGYFDTPGKLFQAVREREGLNPAQKAGPDRTPNADTVGEYLYVRGH